MTKVEEWTNALVGVGALIAFGNQPLKGNCALFVMHITIIYVASLGMNVNPGLFPVEPTTTGVSNKKRQKSPMRMESRVHIPFVILSHLHLPMINRNLLIPNPSHPINVVIHLLEINNVTILKEKTNINKEYTPKYNSPIE